ncbi:hypothetical protein CYMTET_39281 [Cymbomonas tetramitiformis]|uniref:Uncharacterized protein n=1 Tax=Cymbomonas tetramitiformis TaxID=36881 RepID=A0AAE0F4T3_9CHLO|nr:hypothetical protein CYMTET_39281 [Cymbomonas tetramitiformis]
MFCSFNSFFFSDTRNSAKSGSERVMDLDPSMTIKEGVTSNAGVVSAQPGKLLEERLQSSLVNPYGAKNLSKVLRKVSRQCKFFGPRYSPCKWFVVLVRVGRVTVSSVVFCWVGTLAALLREGPRAEAVGDDKFPFTQDFLPDVGVNSGAVQSSVSNLLLRKDIDVPPCNLFLRPTPVMSRKVLARRAINGNNTDI